MKKLVFIISVFLVIITFCACSNKSEFTIDDLTSEDYLYIDAVYNEVEGWNRGKEDSGRTFYIDRISFYYFYELDKVAFYYNYPIAGYSGTGFYVEEDGLEWVGAKNDEFKDISTRHTSCLVNNSSTGTLWDHDATEEEKYQIIVNAYLRYLNGNK